MLVQGYSACQGDSAWVWWLQRSCFFCWAVTPPERGAEGHHGEVIFVVRPGNLTLDLNTESTVKKVVTGKGVEVWELGLELQKEIGCPELCSKMLDVRWIIIFQGLLVQEVLLLNNTQTGWRHYCNSQTGSVCPLAPHVESQSVTLMWSGGRKQVSIVKCRERSLISGITGELGAKGLIHWTLGWEVHDQLMCKFLLGQCSTWPSCDWSCYAL